MKVISKISLTENVAIVSFEKVPARIGFLSDLFDRVARAGINVDMISQTAPKGEQNTLAFTVSDGDVPRILSTVTALKGGESGMMPLVSSGNIKISLYGEEMPSKVGVAAEVFSILKEAGIDLLLITTSDVDISLVVSGPNGDAALCALESALG
ncbi:MAG: ACT domain-containing protein [Oscillospiraceae bacterium]|jgi:aspartokinase|nr:ACT domain-containing protein [Oscillospiraceae bacterium]